MSSIQSVPGHPELELSSNPMHHGVVPPAARLAASVLPGAGELCRARPEALPRRTIGIG
jgi:hypothetical protein